MRNNFFWLSLSIMALLSHTVLGEDLKIPEGSKFQHDTFLQADFWTYEVSGNDEVNRKNKSISRKQIYSYVYEGKRTCSVRYFSVVASFCEEDSGGLAFRHGSTDDLGVQGFELSCELTFISPDTVQLVAVQNLRPPSARNVVRRETSTVTWAFDEKANSWDQLAYQGNYYQESVTDERTHYSGQFVPFSPNELVGNDYGIPIACRGGTAWILAYPN